MAAALKAHGIAYDQVDASTGVGGNWRHGVYRTAHIVSSKKATQYADYPMPEDFPDFPGADRMLAYLESFARDRNLLGSCTFNKKVEHAEPRDDGLWRVRFADGEVRTYKGVAVCNGHHWDKRYPDLPGKFTGEILHSKDYREPAQLEGKRILVIGGGNSGVDMACDGGRFGAACDISLRSGYWYLPKIFFGRPLTDIPLWGLPVFLQRLILKGIVRMSIGDYRRYGLQYPNHKLFERHPAFGTDLLNAIRLGRVTPRPAIARVDGNTVEFEDGTQGVYDIIVAATGFHTSFPFLPEGLVKIENGVVQAYGGAFVEDVRGLYLIGWAQARNGFGRLITPAADLYARMIKLQDDLTFPIGTLLASSITQRLPKTHLVDPEAKRREIRFARYLLPLLKLRDKRLARQQAREEERARAAEQVEA
jgi:cation diffusion facilitator CzcD-associated flavoprotein CzcO